MNKKDELAQDSLKKVIFKYANLKIDSFLEISFSFAEQSARNISFRYFVKSVLARARKNVNKFKGINNIDADIINKLMPNARHFLVRSAIRKFWEDIISLPFIIVYVLISFISITLTPIIVNSFMNESFDSLAFILIFSNILAIQLISMLFVFLFALFPRILKIFHLFFLILSLMSVSTLILNYWPNNFFPAIMFFLVSTFLCQTLFLFGVSFAVIGFAIADIVSLRLLKYRYPDAFIIYQFIELINSLDNGQKSWVDANFRRTILLNIEEVANCIEKDLFRKLKSGDRKTDDKFDKIAHCIAASLRLKKVWVLTPKEDTLEYLLDEFKSYLINIVLGNWDELDQVEPKKISTKRIWLERIRRTFRVLIIGGIPFLALGLIQSSSIALVSPYVDYATIGAILWAVITIVVTFDPLFVVKVDAMRDVMTLLPLSRKNK